MTTTAEGRDIVLGYCAAAFKPDPPYTVSEWADKHRNLSSKSSSEPGRWRTSRTPYLREIMDNLSAYSPVEFQAVMKGVQIGMALDVNTPICTPNGWKFMGAIEVGDTVFDERGEPTRVKWISGTMLGHRCYTVRFSDGAEIVADSGHRWTVDEYNHRCSRVGERTVTTEEMFANFKHKRGHNRYAVKVAKPLELPSGDLPVAPYVLGCWLGDGNSYASQVTQLSADADEMAGYFSADGHRVSIKAGSGITSVLHVDPIERDVERCIRGHVLAEVGTYMRKGKKSPSCAECRRQHSKAFQYGHQMDPVIATRADMAAHLTSMGILKNKSIPTMYLRASRDQRLRLLQGLMDTDGHCTKLGHAEFSNTNSALAWGVFELAASLGLKPVMTEREPMTNGRITGKLQSYRVSFKSYADMPAFRLRRKVERLTKDSKRRTESERRRIVHIEQIESVPVQCIEVESQSHLYLAGQSMIPTHNSEAGFNWVGYTIHHSPSSMMYVMPSLDMMKKFSKTRIDPMVDESPALRERIAPARSRDSGNTVFQKDFDGGVLIMTGANSGSGLRGLPIRKLVLDEVDGYPGSAGEDGDPVTLAISRANASKRRKIFMLSTPVLKASSRIGKAFREGDQRYFHVACDACGARQAITWKSIRWRRDANGEHMPETASFVCQASDPETGELCEHWHGEHRKDALFAAGEWVATAKPSRPNYRSYHLSALYSPWFTWENCVRDLLAAKGDPARMQVFTNNILGEEWEDLGGDRVDPDSLMAKREKYLGCVSRVALLTAGVDVQPDRLEVEVVGWGLDEESWSVDVQVFVGDPSQLEVWDQLDDYLAKRFDHPGFEFGMPISATCIDTGGANTMDAYRFVGPREGRRIWGIKGYAGKRPIWPRKPSRSNKGKINLYAIGVDTAKEVVTRRLTRVGAEASGAGACHFSTEIWDQELFEQLTVERKRTRYVKGFPIVEWWKPDHARNERIDCRVYAYAALSGMISGGFHLNREATRVAGLVAERAAPPLAAEPEDPRDDEPETVRQAASTDAPPRVIPKRTKSRRRRVIASPFM